MLFHRLRHQHVVLAAPYGVRIKNVSELVRAREIVSQVRGEQNVAGVASPFFFGEGGSGGAEGRLEGVRLLGLKRNKFKRICSGLVGENKGFV